MAFSFFSFGFFLGNASYPFLLFSLHITKPQVRGLYILSLSVYFPLYETIWPNGRCLFLSVWLFSLVYVSQGSSSLLLMNCEWKKRANTCSIKTHLLSSLTMPFDLFDSDLGRQAAEQETPCQPRK